MVKRRKDHAQAKLKQQSKNDSDFDSKVNQSPAKSNSNNDDTLVIGSVLETGDNVFSKKLTKSEKLKLIQVKIMEMELNRNKKNLKPKKQLTPQENLQLSKLKKKEAKLIEKINIKNNKLMSKAQDILQNSFNSQDNAEDISLQSFSADFFGEGLKRKTFEGTDKHSYTLKKKRKIKDALQEDEPSLVTGDFHTKETVQNEAVAQAGDKKNSKDINIVEKLKDDFKSLKMENELASSEENTLTTVVNKKIKKKSKTLVNDAAVDMNPKEKKKKKDKTLGKDAVVNINLDELQKKESKKLFDDTVMNINPDKKKKKNKDLVNDVGVNVNPDELKKKKILQKDSGVNSSPLNSLSARNDTGNGIVNKIALDNEKSDLQKSENVSQQQLNNNVRFDINTIYEDKPEFVPNPNSDKLLSNKFLNKNIDLQKEKEGFNKGRFTIVERQLVHDAVNKFLQLHKVGEDKIVDLLHPIRNKVEKHLRGFHKFVHDYSKVNRTRSQVFEYVKDYYNKDVDVKGKWTKEEDIKLEELYLIHSGKWQEISLVLGRGATNCRMRYNTLNRSKNKNLKLSRWNKEENLKFYNHMKEIFSLQHLKSVDEIIDFNINFDEVSKKVESRDGEQCRQKWNLYARGFFIKNCLKINDTDNSLSILDAADFDAEFDSVLDQSKERRWNDHDTLHLLQE
ncbi:RNA polymerase I enhancer binding protein [Clydaea vesicula]|uniref:RNA polymerase I enhancer binding protein n=1 Tax=Clydaea vesicula TaxID=447962 RepID=A0AAD5U1K2_9FUNG|nr:RNA polymerase I enhancer binding protein [Clydaea vesicula]